jgi:hypothetical protein
MGRKHPANTHTSEGRSLCEDEEALHSLPAQALAPEGSADKAAAAEAILHKKYSDGNINSTASLTTIASAAVTAATAAVAAPRRLVTMTLQAAATSLQAVAPASAFRTRAAAKMSSAVTIGGGAGMVTSPFPHARSTKYR